MRNTTAALDEDDIKVANSESFGALDSAPSVKAWRIVEGAKMKKAITISAALFLVAAAAHGSGFMDRSDCLNGPNTLYSGQNGALNALQQRLVACFNYGNSIEVENHNAQARQIQLLANKVDELERRLATQETNYILLETRLSATPH